MVKHADVLMISIYGDRLLFTRPCSSKTLVYELGAYVRLNV